eukprot:evm.model.scf_780.4 EVM.evm.TU.scf_780.4   scf_780:13038-14744(-)
MPPETYLAKKLRELGLSSEGGPAHRRLQFRLYFPRPPYGDVTYTAAKNADGLNFVGQLLGHGGATLQQIQRGSGARIEVHDSRGNLNGNRPDASDCSVHALLIADSREKLAKAAKMIAEVVAPVNCPFERFEVVAGGSAVLRPKVAGAGRGRPARGGSWGGIRKSVSSAAASGGLGPIQRLENQNQVGNQGQENLHQNRLAGANSWDFGQGVGKAKGAAPQALQRGKSWAAVLRAKEGASSNLGPVSEGEGKLNEGLGVQPRGVGCGASDGSSETLSDAKSAELAEQGSGWGAEEFVGLGGKWGAGGAAERWPGRGWEAWGRDVAEPYGHFRTEKEKFSGAFLGAEEEKLSGVIGGKSGGMEQRQVAVQGGMFSEGGHGEGCKSEAGLLRSGGEFGLNAEPGLSCVMAAGLRDRGWGLSQGEISDPFQTGKVQMSHSQISDPFRTARVQISSSQMSGPFHLGGVQSSGSQILSPFKLGMLQTSPEFGSVQMSQAQIPDPFQLHGFWEALVDAQGSCHSKQQNVWDNFGLDGTGTRQQKTGCPAGSIFLDQGQQEEVNQYVNLLKVPLP